MKILLVAALLSMTLACEARYDLDQVEAEAAKSIRRTDNFQSLNFQGNKVVAVGDNGLVTISNDRGETWDRVQLEGRPSLIDVASCPDGSFVVLDFGRSVFTLGVESDLTVSDREFFSDLDMGLALTCDSRGQYWIVGEFTTIWKSDDLGQTWETQSFDRDAIFTAVEFVDESTGFIAGEFGSFLVTNDGGATWEWRAAIDETEEFYPQSMAFKSAAEGWVVGLSGAVYRTKDQGIAWVQEETPLKSGLFGLTIHDGIPIAVGGLGGIIVRDGVWKSVLVEPEIFASLSAVASLDSEHVLVVGRGGAQRLVDVGRGR